MDSIEKEESVANEPFDFSKLKEGRARRKRERQQRAIDMKQALLEKGLPVLKEYGAEKVVLFGSVQRGYCAESSDIDVLAIPIPNERFWQCLHDLREAVEFSVDLYTQVDESIFVEKIKARGEVVYDRGSGTAQSGHSG